AVGVPGNLRRPRRLNAGVLEFPLLQQRRRRAEIARRCRWLELDVVLERIRGEIETIEALGEAGELTPELRHRGIFTQDVLQQTNRVAPAAVRGTFDRLSIRLDDVERV